jgi:hypothetical protein
MWQVYAMVAMDLMAQRKREAESRRRDAAEVCEQPFVGRSHRRGLLRLAHREG